MDLTIFLILTGISGFLILLSHSSFAPFTDDRAVQRGLAAIILIILSVIVFNDGLSINTGTNETGQIIENQTVSGNSTDILHTYNLTTSNQYTNYNRTSHNEIYIVSIVLMLLAVYLIVTVYVLFMKSE